MPYWDSGSTYTIAFSSWELEQNQVESSLLSGPFHQTKLSLSEKKRKEVDLSRIIGKAFKRISFFFAIILAVKKKALRGFE